MKKTQRHPGLLAAVLILVYLAGLASGILALAAYPVYYLQRGFLLQSAQTIAAESLENRSDTINELAGPNMCIYLYDETGACTLRMEGSRSALGTEPEALCLEQLPFVLAGKERFRPVFSEAHNLSLLTGVPIQNSGAAIGAVFLVKNQVDLYGAIFGFLIYFSFFYWLSVYVIITSLRKRRRLEKLQQNYIANITHALKAPIASVKALTETLSDVVGSNPDEQRVYYGMILRETNLQSRMVQEILELSKLQSKGKSFVKEKVSAAEAFAQTFEKYSTLCRCMDIALHVSDGLAQLPALYTDEACIRQVLEILLENAVKYGDGGDIWVSVSASKNLATFCVRDNGVGIAKEDQAHIFERFYRCGRGNNSGGSGLGLAIAKEIMDGLKEKIWVESEPGKGTSFYFTVRLK